MVTMQGVPMKEARPLALVTGASSGIGAELAVELARAGHDLILTGRDAGRLAEAAARVLAAGAAAETTVLDLDDGSSVEALVGAVGSRPLAVLVNNAGFGISGPFAEAQPARLAAMVALNITALTLLTRAFLPAMIGRGSGRILNVASTAAFQPCPGIGRIRGDESLRPQSQRGHRRGSRGHGSHGHGPLSRRYRYPLRRSGFHGRLEAFQKDEHRLRGGQNGSEGSARGSSRPNRGLAERRDDLLDQARSPDPRRQDFRIHAPEGLMRAPPGESGENARMPSATMPSPSSRKTATPN